ncbi:D-amino-acid dehydrogenase [Phycisphaerales bacterium]|nr:D-amino-acid dehydrogenase [Phycisphaerales bacterium]
MTPGRVIVVGSGIVGASCAYELALRGWSVELIDRAAFGAGCSHGNCGYICPSHVYPLARPGAIAATLPLMFRPNSPFKVRIRPDLSLLAWFAKFSRCCDARKAEETSIALHALLVAAKVRYEEIMALEKIDCDYEARGCLFISMHEAHMSAFEADNRRMIDRFGYGARRLNGAELARMEPTLRDGLGGAWMFDCDSHLRSDRFMSGMKAVLTRRGVVIRENCEARALEGSGERAATLATSRGPLRADAFVFATGAWTPLLSELIGIRLPIVPGKGYSVTARRPAHCPAYPMVFDEHRVAITPFGTGYRIGSTMEFAGYDERLRPERIALLKDSAALYLRHSEPLADEEPWWGWRPMVPDGRPFIDFVPRFKNVMVAAGHSMIGMSTGPATGQLVAEMLGGEEPHLEPGWFRVGR